MKEFTINTAVEKWTEGLMASEGISKEAASELEVHLCDAITDLQSSGLTEEESFLIAVRRVGNCESLDREFSSVSQSTVWKRRIFWMLLGFVGFSSLFSLVTTIGYSGAWVAAVLLPYELVPTLSFLWYGMTAIAILIATVFVWRSLLRGNLSGVAVVIGNHPLLTSLAALVLLLVPKIFGMGFSVVSSRILSLQELGLHAMRASYAGAVIHALGLLAICIALAFLARSLRPAKSA